MEVDQSKYNELAERYQGTKRKSIKNLLECGKILCEAKDAMPFGMFGSFLEDTRVSESTRTAQRLMVVFRNFRHLLDKDDLSNQAFASLGVSHLLELQRLPERFKKEIEIVKESEGKEIRDIVKVVDEEKLNDFLEMHVDFEGKQTAVRELPVNEMRKYIDEAHGIFKPEKSDPAKEESPADEIQTHTPNETTSVKESRLPDVKPTSEVERDGIPVGLFSEIKGDLAKLSGDLVRINDKLPHVDMVFLTELSDIEKDVLFKSLNKILELCKRYEYLAHSCMNLKKEATIVE